MYNPPPFVRRAQLSRSLLISQGVNVNSIYTFQNPSANGSAAGADTQLTTIGGFTENYPTQSAYTWNFTVEKDLGDAMVLRASYWPTSRGTCRDRCASTRACRGRRSASRAPAGDPTARQVAALQHQHAGRHFADGESNYQSGEIELTRRFSDGLLFDVNYAILAPAGLSVRGQRPGGGIRCRVLRLRPHFRAARAHLPLEFRLRAAGRERAAGSARN